MVLPGDGTNGVDRAKRDHFLIKKENRIYVCPIALIYDKDDAQNDEELEGWRKMEQLFDSVELSANDGTKRIGHQALMALGCLNTDQ